MKEFCEIFIDLFIHCLQIYQSYHFLTLSVIRWS